MDSPYRGALSKAFARAASPFSPKGSSGCKSPKASSRGQSPKPSKMVDQRTPLSERCNIQAASPKASARGQSPKTSKAVDQRTPLSERSNIQVTSPQARSADKPSLSESPRLCWPWKRPAGLETDRVGKHDGFGAYFTTGAEAADVGDLPSKRWRGRKAHGSPSPDTERNNYPDFLKRCAGDTLQTRRPKMDSDAAGAPQRKWEEAEKRHVQTRAASPTYEVHGMPIRRSYSHNNELSEDWMLWPKQEAENPSPVRQRIMFDMQRAGAPRASAVPDWYEKALPKYDRTVKWPIDLPPKPRPTHP